MADEYLLRVTAGSGYDVAQHVEVPVNEPHVLHIKGKGADIELNVRIQGYHGLPLGSPSSSPYFDTGSHASNGDQYSISFRFKPHAPPASAAGTAAVTLATETDEGEGPHGIKGTDLLFGNDFDHPIRDRLPPGFNKALSMVQWWVDPGLEGDAYADRPHLYGPALSSFNSMQVGPGDFDEAQGGLQIEEGGDDAGVKVRDEAGVPNDSKARMKWALNNENKSKWLFEYGHTYAFDFFNAYLDFANLALKLPGFHIPLMKYWDGQGLRYVLRNRGTDETYLVILFTIHPKKNIDQDGAVKESGMQKRGSTESTTQSHNGPGAETASGTRTPEKGMDRSGQRPEEYQTSPEDVD